MSSVQTKERGVEMSECEFIPDCSFYNDWLKNTPMSAAIIKSRFCFRDAPSCARHEAITTLGKENVPFDLLPVQHSKAKELLSRQNPT